jgi:hypothetical protein
MVGVGGDDPVYAERHGQVGDRVDVFVGQVGGDLHQQRDPPGAGRVQRLADRGEQGAQVRCRLEVAQAGVFGELTLMTR